ncbi:mannosyl-glycoprotein endo-beta-N-acetylglucosamidase [Chryseobacterium sp. 6424]|uniref:glucosaminidase domain-containing protein n=1 Tax=Chryseobacterium sp. 6424 TaxID=2039166 RepID=UPI000EFBEE6D|nr:glucosaminidase domain-containing protein [Chryseobacterium sp. 6424]AYO57151.1 mannosyl-glycoprotein endo-beta-N-acetylglucosamidase [Chryseobacterium sp. 6424]
MKKTILLFSLIILAKIHAQKWKNDEQYIQRFAAYAVEEMEKYKIPASITLAQGLLETGGGQSRLAQQGNNHFGIKCKEDWTGKTMKHTDDAPNECFRVYNDPRESYEDHSKFLAYRKYYTNLFKLDIKDYKAWAHGLKKAGYATNPRYAYILIDKIEKNRLYEFDNTNSKEVLYTVLKLYPALRDDKIFMAKLDQSKASSKPITVTVPYEQTSYAKQQQKVEKIKTRAEVLNTLLVKNHPNGGKKFVIIPDDVELSVISQKFGISESKLMRWNELDGTSLRKNDVIFLEGKASSGNVATYKTKVGESMHEISQKFGIRLSKLYDKNRMAYGEQPKSGQLIYLKDRKPRS